MRARAAARGRWSGQRNFTDSASKLPVGVVFGEVAHDGAAQLVDTGEAAVADQGGEIGEEPFDKVEPGVPRRREVKR